MSAATEERIETPALVPVCLCPWLENPYRLVSLWDIVNEFRLSFLLFYLDKLALLESSCARLRRKEHGGVPVPERNLQFARAFLPMIKEFCEQMGLNSSARIVGRLSSSIVEEKPPKRYPKGLIGPMRIDVAEFQTEISHIQDSIDDELKHHGYVHVQPDRVAYCMKDDLFGKEVTRSFPSAAYDIREAGNCLSVELNTAAVFHLMRVAEFGLRALAHDRRIIVPKGPLDLATWEDILKELDKAEQAIQGYPKTHAREAQYEFYHGAMMELRAFKNTWRNRFMHTRADMREDKNRDKAKSVMTHVGEFMKILASKIAENKRTPMIWKRV